MKKLTREIVFHPAYDHRGRPKNGGIGAVVACFILRGPKGAITWDLATGWYVHTAEVQAPTPMAADYHKPIRMRKADREAWSRLGQSGCTALNGRACESDGTACTEDIFQLLVTEGSEGVWNRLEGLYRSWLDPQAEVLNRS